MPVIGYGCFAFAVGQHHVAEEQQQLIGEQFEEGEKFNSIFLGLWSLHIALVLIFMARHSYALGKQVRAHQPAISEVHDGPEVTAIHFSAIAILTTGLVVAIMWIGILLSHIKGFCNKKFPMGTVDESLEDLLRTGGHLGQNIMLTFALLDCAILAWLIIKYATKK